MPSSVMIGSFLFEEKSSTPSRNHAFLAQVLDVSCGETNISQDLFIYMLSFD